MKSQLELLEIQDSEAAKNTYYRYPKVSPTINQYNDHIEVKTIEDKSEIYYIDEIVLYIIARFRWAPAWLIQQWYEVYNLDGYKRIEDYIKVGLVWAETGSTGVFIRPTYFLFELMDIPDNKYTEVPFNLLNHTCAEMQMVFDVMSYNKKAEIWQFLDKKQCLPTYHPLHLQGDLGSPIFIEEEFKAKTKDINNDALIESIQKGSKFTLEFIDNSLFTLVTDIDGKPYTQRPDLCIPAMRLPDGKPQSWAIEMELSAKQKVKYDKIMNSYKNNLVYGNLLYLCGNNYIVEQVKKAYQDIGGLGTCKLFVAPWAAPAQRITNYSYKEEEAYKQLLDTTIKGTKKEV